MKSSKDEVEYVKADNDDICIWPNGLYSNWRDMTEIERVSGDYVRLPVDSPQWIEFVNSDECNC